MTFRSRTRAALALLLTGCSVGPDYKKPDVPTADAFGVAPGDNAYQKDGELGTWWRNFGDETLDALVDQTVAGNNRVEVAVSRINESRALRRDALIDLFPTPAFDASQSTRRISAAQPFIPPSAVRPFEFYRVGFDLQYEVDLFGRVRRGLEAATAAEEASAAELGDVVRSVVAEVASSYVELRGAQARLDVARKNAKVQEDTVALTRALVESGQSSELDNARARGQLETTLATIPPLEAEVRQYGHQIAVLTGKEPRSLTPLLTNSGPLPKYGGKVTLGDPALLLQRRPDVRQAERTLAAATANIGVAKGDLFPKVSFVGNVGLEASTPARFHLKAAQPYSFGPSITWAAFDIGSVLARAAAADARAAQALGAYRDAVLLALRETEDALVRFGAERTRRDHLRLAAKATVRARDLAQIRYKDGLADFLTVLDAQREVLAAEDALARSETLVTVNLVALYKALGGGWGGVSYAERGEKGLVEVDDAAPSAPPAVVRTAAAGPGAAAPASASTGLRIK